jgi:hypothetical protein
MTAYSLFFSLHDQLRRTLGERKEEKNKKTEQQDVSLSSRVGGDSFSRLLSMKLIASCAR